MTAVNTKPSDLNVKLNPSEFHRSDNEGDRGGGGDGGGQHQNKKLKDLEKDKLNKSEKLENIALSNQISVTKVTRKEILSKVIKYERKDFLIETKTKQEILFEQIYKNAIDKSDDKSNENITTIVTCEGDYYDPNFIDSFNIIVDHLERLLFWDLDKTKLPCRTNSSKISSQNSLSSSKNDIVNIIHSNDKKIKIVKLEPWNSVRVTLTIPKEAALRLRELASQGSDQLRQLGILSVQVEGDQLISLRFRTVDNNIQEIVLSTTNDNNEPSTSGLQRLSDKSSLVQSSSSAFVVPGPSASSTVQFRSPNVICPTDTRVPTNSTVQNRSVTSTKPVQTPLSKPSRPSQQTMFPFASMQQAAIAIQRQQQNNTPLRPPHILNPYPKPSTIINSVTSPRLQQNIALSSPLLVNLLQNDANVTSPKQQKLVGDSTQANSILNSSETIQQANGSQSTQSLQHSPNSPFATISPQLPQTQKQIISTPQMISSINQTKVPNLTTSSPPVNTSVPLNVNKANLMTNKLPQQTNQRLLVATNQQVNTIPNNIALNKNIVNQQQLNSQIIAQQITQQKQNVVIQQIEHQRLQQQQQLRNNIQFVQNNRLIQHQKLIGSENQQPVVVSNQLNNQQILMSAAQNQQQIIVQQRVAIDNHVINNQVPPPPYPGNRFQNNVQQIINNGRLSNQQMTNRNYLPNQSLVYQQQIQNDQQTVQENSIDTSSSQFDNSLSNITPSLTDLSKADLDSLLPSLTDLDGDLLNEIAKDIAIDGDLSDEMLALASSVNNDTGNITSKEAAESATAIANIEAQLRAKDDEIKGIAINDSNKINNDNLNAEIPLNNKPHEPITKILSDNSTNKELNFSENKPKVKTDSTTLNTLASKSDLFNGSVISEESNKIIKTLSSNDMKEKENLSKSDISSNEILNEKQKFLINPLNGNLEPIPSDSSDSETESKKNEVFDVFSGFVDDNSDEDGDINKNSSENINRPKQILKTEDSRKNLLAQQIVNSGKNERKKNFSKLKRINNISPNSSSLVKIVKPKEKISPVITTTSSITSSPGGNIKLRLKIDKNEPAYNKVDVVRDDTNKIENDTSNITTNVQNSTSSLPIALNVSNSLETEPPRVPPLHISLRGRNSVVIKNSQKRNVEQKSKISPNQKLNQMQTSSPSMSEKTSLTQRQKIMNKKSESLDDDEENYDSDEETTTDDTSDEDEDEEDFTTETSEEEEEELLNELNIQEMKKFKNRFLNKSNNNSLLDYDDILSESNNELLDEYRMYKKLKPNSKPLDKRILYGKSSTTNVISKINILKSQDSTSKVSSPSPTSFTSSDLSNSSLDNQTLASLIAKKNNQLTSGNVVNGMISPLVDKKRKLNETSRASPVKESLVNFETKNINEASLNIGSTNSGSIPPTSSTKSFQEHTKQINNSQKLNNLKLQRPVASGNLAKLHNKHGDKTYSKLIAEKRMNKLKITEQQNPKVVGQKDDKIVISNQTSIALPQLHSELNMEAKFKQRLLEDSLVDNKIREKEITSTILNETKETNFKTNLIVNTMTNDTNILNKILNESKMAHYNNKLMKNSILNKNLKNISKTNSLSKLLSQETVDTNRNRIDKLVSSDSNNKIFEKWNSDKNDQIIDPSPLAEGLADRLPINFKPKLKENLQQRDKNENKFQTNEYWKNSKAESSLRELLEQDIPSQLNKKLNKITEDSSKQNQEIKESSNFDESSKNSTKGLDSKLPKDLSDINLNDMRSNNLSNIKETDELTDIVKYLNDQNCDDMDDLAQMLSDNISPSEKLDKQEETFNESKTEDTPNHNENNLTGEENNSQAITPQPISNRSPTIGGTSSQNGNSAGGEDSGIESMDALSEKSPNTQSSPHCHTELPNLVDTLNVDNKSQKCTKSVENSFNVKTIDYNKEGENKSNHDLGTDKIESKQSPSVDNNKAEFEPTTSSSNNSSSSLASNLNISKDCDNIISDNQKSNEINDNLDQMSNKNIIVEKNPTGLVNKTIKEDKSRDKTSPIENKMKSLDDYVVDDDILEDEDKNVDEFDLLPVRRTPPLYTYSNSDKQMSRDINSPMINILEDMADDYSEEYHSDALINSDTDDTMSTKSTLSTNKLKNKLDSIANRTSKRRRGLDSQSSNNIDQAHDKKCLMEQLVIEIPSNNVTDFDKNTLSTSTASSPNVSERSFVSSTRTTRTRSITSKLNSPDLIDTIKHNLRSKTATAQQPSPISPNSASNSVVSRANSPSMHLLKTSQKNVKRKRNESETSVEDNAKRNNTPVVKRARKISENENKETTKTNVSNKKVSVKTVEKAPDESGNKKVSTKIPGQINPVTGKEESSDSDEPLIEIVSKTTNSSKKQPSQQSSLTRNSKNKNITISNTNTTTPIRRSVRNTPKTSVSKSNRAVSKLNTSVNTGNSAINGMELTGSEVSAVDVVNDGNQMASVEGGAYNNTRRKTRSAVNESPLEKRLRQTNKDNK